MLINKIDILQDHVLLYCDSQSTIYLVKIWIFYSKIKHIDIKHQLVRVFINSRKVNLQKIDTQYNLTYILSMLVYVETFMFCLDLLSIKSIWYIYVFEGYIKEYIDKIFHMDRKKYKIRWRFLMCILYYISIVFFIRFVYWFSIASIRDFERRREKRRKKGKSKGFVLSSLHS